MSKAQTVAIRKLFLWDEVNRLTTDFTSFDKPVKEQRKRFEDFLLDAYIEGFASALYFLDGERNISHEMAKEAVDKKYDGESIFAKFEDYYEKQDAESINRLVESEFHRVNEQGAYEAAKTFEGVKKRWSAILDNKTRMTHEILNGTAIGIDERFYSISGDSALFPGGFATAEENANCRCMVEYFTE